MLTRLISQTIPVCGNAQLTLAGIEIPDIIPQSISVTPKKNKLHVNK
jgi:hypothetical protein